MKHLERPFLIALTGGIASGKSIVSKWFSDHNFSVFDADKIGHELFDEQYFINKIKDLFGKEIIVNGSIDRAKLGKIIFDSVDKRKQLNNLLHPEIRKRMQHIVDASSQNILIFEIPLLFENGLQKAFDLTINISAQNKIRIKRIIERDKITEIEAQKRINSQMSEFDKQNLADINIVNEEGNDELNLQLQKLILHIRELKKKNIKKIAEL
ncbi:MAG: dephospho-CoA kinase [Candidatus Cloacimonetes bacterium]|nr:dephospho-CoA kinase [Candidatus Cloacimonadota bacterium]